MKFILTVTFFLNISCSHTDSRSGTATVIEHPPDYTANVEKKVNNG